MRSLCTNARGLSICLISWRQLQAWNFDSLKELLNDWWNKQPLNGCRLTTKFKSTILETYLKRAKHASKEIEAALRFAESEKWRVDVGGSHAWGKMFCPFNQETCRCGEFCITSIWSTPRDAENHARALKKVVEKCEVRVCHLRRLIQKFIKIEKK